MDTCGSALIIQEDNCSVDGKGNESSGEVKIIIFFFKLRGKIFNCQKM